MESQVPRTAKFKPDARRYRANIYITGPTAYDEDNWTLIRIGNNKYHVSCRTTRCKLPNTDPDTGNQDKKGNQPLSTMSKYRGIDAGDRPHSPCLGMHLVPTKDAVGSMIRVGDQVEMLKKGEHFFVADPAPEKQRPVY
jgi:uncharacterized protein YcbX